MHINPFRWCFYLAHGMYSDFIFIPFLRPHWPALTCILSRCICLTFLPLHLHTYSFFYFFFWLFCIFIPQPTWTQLLLLLPTTVCKLREWDRAAYGNRTDIFLFYFSLQGLPLHVQIDTFEDPRDINVFHRGYCQIKVFCDKVSN